MKKIFLLSLLSAFYICSFSQEQTQPLIKNGDMELWRDNKEMPNNWNSYHTILREGIFSRSTDARSGKNAIEVNFEPQREHDNRRFFTFPMKLSAYKYKVTFHFKGDADIRFITLTKKGNDASGKSSDINLVGAPALGKIEAKEWTAYSISFDVKDTADYQLFICVNSAKKFLIDDVSMEVLDN